MRSKEGWSVGERACNLTVSQQEGVKHKELEVFPSSPALLCMTPSVLGRTQGGIWGTLVSHSVILPGDIPIVLYVLWSYLQVKTPLIFPCAPRGLASILHKWTSNIYEWIDFQWISAASRSPVRAVSLQLIRPSSPSPMCGEGCRLSLPQQPACGLAALRLSPSRPCVLLCLQFAAKCQSISPSPSVMSLKSTRGVPSVLT